MDFKEIQDLIKLINRTNISEFKLEEENFKVSIRSKSFVESKFSQQPQVISVPSVTAPQVLPAAPVAAPAPAAAPAAAPAPAAEEAKPAADANAGLIEVKSPIVGTFYRSAGPDKPAFAKIGDTIQVGQVICIVEAMKLFNEIESEVSGKVVKVLVEDASPVEYDQPLFLLDPKG